MNMTFYKRELLFIFKSRSKMSNWEFSIWMTLEFPFTLKSGDFSLLVSSQKRQRFPRRPDWSYTAAKWMHSALVCRTRWMIPLRSRTMSRLIVIPMCRRRNKRRERIFDFLDSSNEWLIERLIDWSLVCCSNGRSIDWLIDWSDEDFRFIMDYYDASCTLWAFRKDLHW